MRDAVWLGWRHLSRRPLRVLLLAAGVATAVAVAIGMLSILASSQERLTAALETLGTRVVVVTPDAPSQPLPEDSVEAVRQIVGVEAVVGLEASAATRVTAAPPALAAAATPLAVTDVFRTDSSVAAVLDLEVRGRDLQPMDVTLGRRVAVLGADAAGRLGLPSELVIDSSVTVDGVDHRVVGVLQPSAGGLATVDTAVFVPRRGEVRADTVVFARTAPGLAQDVASVADRALGVLDPDASVIVRSARAVATAERVSNEVLEWATIGAATVAAVAGAISIISALNASVRNRRREIGLQRAFGAHRRTVVLTVLVESCGIGAVGCAVGSAVALAATAAVARANGWPMVVDGGLVAVTVTAAMVLSLAAGSVPASTASRTDPAETLRTD